MATPSGWTHIVLNYLGPENGQGNKVYFNGTQVRSAALKAPITNNPGGGRVVVGRHYVDNTPELFFISKAIALLFNWKYVWGRNLVWMTCRRCTDDVQMMCG